MRSQRVRLKAYRTPSRKFMTFSANEHESFHPQGKDAAKGRKVTRAIGYFRRIRLRAAASPSTALRGVPGSREIRTTLRASASL